MKYKTQIITDVSNVPAGFVPATEFKLSRQKVLSKAAVAGEIESVKLMRTPFDVRGPVFYRDEQALDYCDAYFGPDPEADRYRAPEADAEPVAPSNPVLRGITPGEAPKAVESPAPAPSEATHTAVLTLPVSYMSTDRLHDLGVLMTKCHFDLVAKAKTLTDAGEQADNATLVANTVETIITLADIVVTREVGGPGVSQEHRAILRELLAKVAA